MSIVPHNHSSSLSWAATAESGAVRLDDTTTIINPVPSEPPVYTLTASSGGGGGSGTMTGAITSTGSSVIYPPNTNVTYTTGTTIPAVYSPFSITDGTGSELLRLDSNGELRISRIKSDEKSAASEHSHVLQGFFHIEASRIVGGFKCLECGEVLAEKVLLKVPKNIKKSQCLPRILKKV